MTTASQPLGMFTPIKALWRWLMTTPGPSQNVKSPAQHRQGSGLCHGNTLRSQGLRSPLHLPTPPALRRPLRMVRVMEAGQTPSQVGRMVISGRMADVCAELDRLAAHEARLH